MDVGLTLYRESPGPYCLGISSPTETGSPIKLFEHMAMGLVPIASPLQQVTERVIRNGQNGFIIGFQDHEALVRVLGRIQSNRADARAIGKRAMRDAREYFNWKRVASETAAALREVTELGVIQ